MGTATQSKGVERATDTLDILGESAIWCSTDKVLYWVDIRAPALRRLEPQTGEVTSWVLNDLCGAVVLSTDRRLLLAMRTGQSVYYWRDDDGITSLRERDVRVPGSKRVEFDIVLMRG